jgi:hypothetical protein
MYYIYDEIGELMRKVRRQEEMKELLSIYKGWTATYVKVKRKLDMTQFQEALI